DEGRLRWSGHGACEDEVRRRRRADRRRLPESHRIVERESEPRHHGMGGRRGTVSHRRAGRGAAEEFCRSWKGPYTQPLEKQMKEPTRRECLEVLAAGAALGAVAGLKGQSPIVRTLLKDISPNDIAGATLFHEHLSIRYPLTKALAEAQGRPVPPSFTDDVDLMIEETKAAKAAGVGCIVDGGHPDMDRDLAALTHIAKDSGVPIVASGGFYMQRNYPPDIAAKSADQIADELARDAKAQRLGAFGEIGQQGGVLTDDEKKVFTAVGKAQVKTGLPIFTH